MIYELKNCRDGKKASYKTTVEITEKEGILTFDFYAENSAFYCPFPGYNGAHSSGDACEVLIGSDKNRKVYYEIEISPEGDLMLGKISYLGEDENGPKIKVELEKNCFVKGFAEKIKNSYRARVSFEKEKIMTGDGDVFFNAYRLDTDGVETDRHLFALSPTMRPKFHTPEYFIKLSEYVNK